MQLRVNPKILLILAAVAVPLLLVDLFFVLDRSRRALDTTVGNHLKNIAEVMASETSRFVHAKIVEIGILAAEEELRRAAVAANQKTATDAVIREIDRNWETAKTAEVANRLLAHPASEYLRGYLSINLSVKRLLLTDERGVSVAGSHKPIDYFQGDEEWWTACYRDGAGAIHVGDVGFDPVSRTNFLAIDAPVLTPGRDRVIGVLRAIVDVAEMRPITTQIQMGGRGEAMLVKGDGTILSSRNIAQVGRLKAEEMEVVGPLAGDQASGYTSASLKGGSQKMIAFADPGLGQAFPELNWRIIVTQDLEEARAPIAAVTNRAMGTAFGGLLLFALLAAYFSLHRPQKFTDLEEAGATPSR
jgi:hypothetical protein